MNPLPFKLNTGTFGELFAQFRLLQFDVQAAPPLKDTGNDLIAVRGEVFRAISVRATTGSTFNKPKAGRLYHILAVVRFQKSEVGEVLLDQTDLFLVPRAAVAALQNNISAVERYRICEDLVDEFFPKES
jgi:hypothetical protein